MTASNYETLKGFIVKHHDTRAALFAMVESQPENKLSVADEERLVGRTAKAILAAGSDDTDLINDIVTDMLKVIKAGDTDGKAINKFYAELIAELDIVRTPKELTLNPFFAKRMELIGKAEGMDMASVERGLLKISAAEHVSKHNPDASVEQAFMYADQMKKYPADMGLSKKSFGGRLTPRFKGAGTVAQTPPTRAAETAEPGIRVPVL